VERHCKYETENEFINKARFEQNKDCMSNWIRRVNRKRRDRLQSFIFIGPCIVKFNNCPKSIDTIQFIVFL